ncbi:MAG: hypothetical protein M1818_001178 [Claussenomyces sp. TS43310]|nr:MAG: hypothetical protein M1818_001178 [Claussenomyces sp. TS43310]
MAPKQPDSDHIGHSLLARAHSPSSTTRIFTEKVKVRPLHLKPTDPSSSAPNARSYRRAQRLNKIAARKTKLKPKPLSAREKRATGIHEIPREERRYDIYEPLHQLWLGYIHEILGISEGKLKAANTGSAATLASADFHGADLEVVRSRCVSRVGVRGIVVKDTKFTFDIITKSNELKTLPKEHTVFRFEVPWRAGEGDQNGQERPLAFELHGEQFQHRAVDRANKKFKPHFLPDL